MSEEIRARETAAAWLVNLTSDERQKAQRAQSRIDHFGHDKVAGTAVEFAAIINALRIELRDRDEALRELCRGHNARGSDGPCDCAGCRVLKGGE